MPLKNGVNQAKRLTDYLASLTVTQGRLAGAPFPVLPWERRFTGLADPGP